MFLCLQLKQKVSFENPSKLKRKNFAKIIHNSTLVFEIKISITLYIFYHFFCLKKKQILIITTTKALKKLSAL